MSQLLKIGKLSRLHGLKGAMVVSGNNLADIEIKKNGFLFIEMKGVPTPFFVVEHKFIGKNLTLRFDGINSIEDAKALIGMELFGDDKNVSVKKNSTGNLQGYDLIDENKGNVGKVNELIVLPKQQFLSININDDEVLLPYTDVFVRKIDHQAKIIYYCAPDGLFDMN